MNTKKATIFLVDDDITNLTIGKNVLMEYYNVYTLNSGERLLKMLEKNIPDLILLDIEMPEMNGYDTMKFIKEKKETANIPVIFVTAKNDVSNELKGLSLGAIDYISKPFSPPLLLKRIELHLLIANQTGDLLSYNENLQKMIETKTKTVLDLQNAILKTLAELVEYRDDITGGHIERTQSYLRVLIDALKKHRLYQEEINSWNIDLVLQSAQLHDVGKIAIKDYILQKPGKLTNEEFEQIKTHTTFGEEIIEKIKMNTNDHEFLNYAKVLVSTHHEKWDGNGYPMKMKGEEIPLLGRLMAIADVYDALVSERPYKKAFAHQQAVDIIEDGKGTHFDPVLVDLFKDVSYQFDEIATKSRV